MKRKCLGFFTLFSLCLYAMPAQATENPYNEAWKNAITYLQSTQTENGGWSTKRPGSVGITAVVLESLTYAPSEIKTPALGKIMKKAADYIAGSQQKDGAIHDPHAPKNYSTSLAVQALARFDKKTYAPVIEKAVTWIKDIQATAEKGYDPKKHKTYGGFGYGSSLRPDLSNTWIALNALKEAGVPEDDPVWKAAAVFIKRCQNSTEVNDQPYAGTDGGAMYLPAESPAKETKDRSGKTVFTSYGSMSYAMLLSYLWCDFKKTDQPVKLVTAWLAKNYSVDKHPNAQKEEQQGLYYYYRVMSKSLAAYGESNFAGHDWPKELANAIVKRQNKDGFWNNPQDRWREGDPALVTGYSLTALGLCMKHMKAEPTKK